MSRTDTAFDADGAAPVAPARADAAPRAMTDAWGAPVTGPADALPGIDDFVVGFARYEPRAANVLATADAEPGSALANVYAGFLHLFSESPAGPANAEPYRARAAAVRGTNGREKGLLALLEAWQRREHGRVIDVAGDVLERCPRDLSTLKLAQYHAFNRGDAATMLRLAEGVRGANEGRAAWHAMLAFGHEQLHALDEAEAAAHRALELEPGEPWAHHAIAHVHLGRGTLDAGRAFLEDRSHHWTRLNSFMFTHNWWHLALFEIATGRSERALGVYDERCWGAAPGMPGYSQDQVGAVSLLARLECAGVDVGPRWAALAPHLEARGEDVEQPFLSLQYLYGLARAGSPAVDALLDALRRQAVEPVVVEDRELWDTVGVPVAEGLVAHARGDFDAAVERLSVPWRERVRLGGSHAQRDLFEQLRLDAMWRSGRRTEALALMRSRLRFEPDNPLLVARIAEAETAG